MWENVGVFRTRESLVKATDKINQLQEEAKQVSISYNKVFYNREVIEALENENMLEIAKCITNAALKRTESRGAHYRYDFPDSDNSTWLKHITFRKEDEQIKLRYRPVDLKIFKLKGVDYER